MGKLIVLEGVDATGKTTQFDLLTTALTQRGVDFRPLSFPCYESDSSALVRMYLRGDFGSAPDAVSPYGASVFYAADRYASYLTGWGEYYRDGGLLVAARYTTSNAIHQGAKVPEGELPGFLRWLEHFEYTLLGLPAPDLVLLLDMPSDFSAQLMEHRRGEGASGADIHEADPGYLARCKRTADLAAQLLGWSRVECVRDGALRGVQDIHGEILGAVCDVLAK